MSTSSSSSLSTFVGDQLLPSVVRVLDGCCGSISVNNDNELYVHSTSVQSVVVAETLNSESTGPARRLKTTRGKTVSLPLDYPGLFELMSVDGRTAQAMTSVLQLVDAFPARCLVRKTIHALTPDDVRRGDGVRSRCVTRGEVVTLVRVAGKRLLHCRDVHGNDIYLPVSERGLFSPVNQHAVAGVHTLRSLLAEFRLPVIVRLVCGPLPRHVGTASVMRLAGIQTDRVVFVLPLRHAWASTSFDRQALVPVASKHASRLSVVEAARDFYHDWLTTDDGLQLRGRCDEIVSEWLASVHVVPAVTADVTESRTDAGDDAVWSRGPIGSSLDSGLASSASAPSIACNNDNVDEHLEHEIEDIYEMIRYGSDYVARQHARSQSLGDCVTAADDIFTQNPTTDVRPMRRPSADFIGGTAQTSATTRRMRMNRKQRNKVDDVLPTVDSAHRCSSAPAVNLLRVTVFPVGDIDTTDNGGVFADRDSHDEMTSPRRLSESDTTVARCRIVDSTSDDDYDKVSSTIAVPPLAQQHYRSQSVPEIKCSATKTHETSRKSVVGSLARSIANVFRRMRLHKTSRTFNVDTGLTTVVCERYSKTTWQDAKTSAVRVVDH